MHQAGLPDADSCTIPCPCGQAAHYKELRSRNVLTVLGPVPLSRPYYVCADCSKGQYPADPALGVAGLEYTAEAISTQISQRDEQEIGRAKQLVLPVVPNRTLRKYMC